MRESPRILVTGHGGLLGSHLVRRLDGKYPVTALSRRRLQLTDPTTITQLNIDMTDPRALSGALVETSPDIIINCAALSDVDRCQREPELARLINTEAVSQMANFSAAKRRFLIHISTDYIFDGKAGPYPEDAAPNPINFYGRTKLEAEETVSTSGCEHVIIRTNHVFGNLPDGPSKLLRWLLDAGPEGRKIMAASDQYNNSTWAGNLADAICEVIESSFRGVINVGGADYLSRYEFALLGAAILGIERDLVVKTALDTLEMDAPRPLRAGLALDKMKRTLKTSPLGVAAGLALARDGAL